MVVRLQYVSGCGKSTIKVRRKYAESKVYIRLKYGKSTVKYGKSTVKYGKSTVLYGNFFLAPTVYGHMCVSTHMPHIRIVGGVKSHYSCLEKCNVG